MDTTIHDRRVKRTQNLLATALISLTLEKGYEAITIRDITERADIGYATFFRHYHDKAALLRDVLDVVLDELTTVLLPSSVMTDPVNVGSVIFRYVQDHSELVRVLLNSGGSLVQRIVETSTNNVLQSHVPRRDSLIPPEIAANHLVTASIALIQWWLDHDMPYPPERMGEIYHELILRPTHASAFESGE